MVMLLAGCLCRSRARMLSVIPKAIRREYSYDFLCGKVDKDLLTDYQAVIEMIEGY